jgi:hypothetical protein
MLTAEKLRELLHYNPDTGIFTWKKRPAHKGQDMTWNARFAGKRAGTIQKKEGYRRIRIHSHDYQEHCLAWLYMTGEWAADMVDHANLIRSDNRWDNLRSATGSENCANAKLSSRNTSGFKGVCWYRAYSKWRAQIMVRGKHVTIGYFSNPEEAHAAYVAAAEKYFGKFARAA